jgi:hypothetical protein
LSASTSTRPAHAVVLSVDEKNQIQALDRTPQPGLPMKPGRAGTMTHDYKRHGTTTLFAALNVHDGTVIGPNMTGVHPLPQHHRGAGAEAKDHPSHRRQLRNPQTPQSTRRMVRPASPSLDLPLHADFRILAQRRAEGFFAKLTRRRLMRGVVRSVDDLKTAINRFIAETNADPKPSSALPIHAASSPLSKRKKQAL